MNRNKYHSFGLYCGISAAAYEKEAVLLVEGG